MRNFLIGYFHNTGNGSCVVESNVEKTSKEWIDLIKDQIEKRTGMENVGIFCVSELES